MKLFGFGFYFISFLYLFNTQSIAAVQQPRLIFKTPALDVIQIQKKCAVYQERIERIEAQRTCVFSAVGLLGAVAVVYCIHAWFVQKKPAAVSDVATQVPITINQDVFNALIAQRLVQASTFGGKLSLMFEHSRDKVLSQIITLILGAIVAYPALQLVSSFTEKVSGWLWFDGEKKLAKAEQIFLRDARFFYQSFVSFLKAPAHATATAPYAQRLTEQMRRGVDVDFTVLCYTLEESFALLLACITQCDNLDDDEQHGLENEVAAMCDVFNSAAQEIAGVLTAHAEDMDNATTSMIVVPLQKLLGECERLMHSIGMRLFGERFAL